MKTPRTRIADTIAKQTLKAGESKAYAKEIAAYLIAEGRTGELDSLLRDVQAEWAEQGHVEVLARTAHSLTAEAKSQITAKAKALYPGAKSVIVTEIADPSVLGGLQLTVANQQLDDSVEAKLNKFKQLTGAKT